MILFKNKSKNSQKWSIICQVSPNNFNQSVSVISVALSNLYNYLPSLPYSQPSLKEGEFAWKNIPPLVLKTSVPISFSL